MNGTLATSDVFSCSLPVAYWFYSFWSSIAEIMNLLMGKGRSVAALMDALMDALS